MDQIIYHNNCPDGWCAAYICKMKYPEAEFVPMNHGVAPEEIEKLIANATGKDVLMVDYSLRTRELNDRLNSAAKSLRILDHHKVAQAELEGAPYATFDMKRSGAGLAWDYLFGKDSKIMWEGQELCPPPPAFYQTRPWWVNYVEDQDLWNWVLPNSQEVNAFLMVQPRDMKTWSEITMLEKDSAGRAGHGVRQYIEYYTRYVTAEVRDGIFEFEGRKYHTGVLNMPYVGVSEACSALNVMGYEIGLAWFERGDGIIQFSLRSSKQGDVDVSAIAKAYGGGGHRTAAGFQVNLFEGRKIVDRILNRDAFYDQRSSGGCVK